MSYLNKLFDLADDLSNSASSEGCDDSLIVVGSKELRELLQWVRLLKASTQVQDPSNHADAEIICKRLVDSEEHALEAAIPPVAEEAVETINRLSSALAATQHALSQAMQHSETANKLVEGYLDSH